MNLWNTFVVPRKYWFFMNDVDYEVGLRIWEHASNHLIVPGKTFAGACVLTLSISCYEGYIHLRNPSHIPQTRQEYRFVVRYGLANLVPSFASSRVRARTLVSALNIDPSILIQPHPTNVKIDRWYRQLSWNRKRLQSYRGAVATTMLLTQLLSMVQVVSQATLDYQHRLREGKEPPLLYHPSQRQVVLRLAGETSDVTSLSMQRDGPSNYFPIYENSNLLGVKKLVRQYGLPNKPTAGGYRFGIPVYWQVDDGHYGHYESWQGMTIPQRWLFDKKIVQCQTTGKEDMEEEEENTMNHTSSIVKTKTKKLLILEADAIREHTESSWMLAEPKEFLQRHGLDLYEMTQGFYHLKRLVEGRNRQHDDDDDNDDTTATTPCGDTPFDVLRVLLADASAIVNRGSGTYFTVREFATDIMGMVDIVIDTRTPIIFAITTWLDYTYKQIQQQQQQQQQEQGEVLILNQPSIWKQLVTYAWSLFAQSSSSSSNDVATMKPVILMTPNPSSFSWIQKVLAQSKYRVLDYRNALDEYGTDSISTIPILVYEPTTLDTIHTVERLVEDRESYIPHQRDRVCAICPTHRGLTTYQAGERSEIFAICASDTYDYLLRQVLMYAQEGYDYQWIQQQLDHNLQELIGPKTFLEREKLGFPPL